MLATTETQSSSDARVRVEYQSHEVKMSHWIDQPRVVDTTTNTVLLDLWPDEFASWDGHAHFERLGLIRLELREYPGNEPSAIVYIDVNAHAFSCTGRTLPPAIKQALSRHLREITPAPH